MGVEVNELYTGTIVQQPGGALYMEGNGINTSSAGGESEVLKFRGMGRSTGAGYKAIYRGSTFCESASSKFAKLLTLMTVWEVDIDEAGNFLLKIREWM